MAPPDVHATVPASANGRLEWPPGKEDLAGVAASAASRRRMAVDVPGVITGAGQGQSVRTWRTGGETLAVSNGISAGRRSTPRARTAAPPEAGKGRAPDSPGAALPGELSP